MTEFFQLLINRQSELYTATFEHLWLSFASLFIALLISVPLGIVLTRSQKLAGPVIGVASVFQTIPSLALLGFMIPLFGIGSQPAIIALTIYGILPILRNTYTGIMRVEPALKEAGRGMGMTDMQILRMVELPMALSVIMAGIRTSTVLIIGVATLATLIGAGGLGDFIFRGIAMAYNELILLGAIPAALLAIILDATFAWVEKRVTPKGIKTA
ncbi:ABC transporter permease [Heliorestis convoluta]|uniref:Binding-protein-dependent transport system inner membrane component family protein n=1 Tax=Heliorestis convoluta TaxID=356322 RepID=A0A5Q2N1X2_9FIRM|nr:ABC transporter permease [Heliorestis convoluta]QGG48998.1 binding-protein-dependent transport system inner membrane component family protein [Heliorestis convoluta]